MVDEAHQKNDMHSAGDSLLPFVLPFVGLLAAPVLVGWLVHGSMAAGSITGNSDRVTAFDWQVFLSAVAQVLIVSGCLWWFRKVYWSVFPWRFSPWSLGVGVVGVILWVGLCGLNLESRLLQSFGLQGILPQRPGVNPFVSFGDLSVGWFLFFRFTVLMLIVPIAEELFVRGWLVRYLEAQENWDIQPLATVSWPAMSGVIAYAILTHPQEAVAAIAWFAMVNWWMKRTGNFWDCVIVHSVTNGLLGAWILFSGQWRLW